jgi:hypothetical protein
MHGALTPFPQYAPMAWNSVNAHGQLDFYLRKIRYVDVDRSQLAQNIK